MSMVSGMKAEAVLESEGTRFERQDFGPHTGLVDDTSLYKAFRMNTPSKPFKLWNRTITGCTLFLVSNLLPLDVVRL